MQNATVTRRVDALKAMHAKQAEELAKRQREEIQELEARYEGRANDPCFACAQKLFADGWRVTEYDDGCEGYDPIAYATVVLPDGTNRGISPDYDDGGGIDNGWHERVVNSDSGERGIEVPVKVFDFVLEHLRDLTLDAA